MLTPFITAIHSAIPSANTSQIPTFSWSRKSSLPSWKVWIILWQGFSHRGSRLPREQRWQGLLRWPRLSLLFLIRSSARWLHKSNKKCSAHPADEQRFKELQTSELW